jgi:hypothetical protein
MRCFADYLLLRCHLKAACDHTNTDNGQETSKNGGYSHVAQGRTSCHLTMGALALYLHYLVRRRTGTEFAISGSFNFEHSGHRATKTVGLTTSPGILLSTATDLLAPFGSR